ncbi:MAG: cysteine synthase A, partial [Gemmatimonadota bacterium]
MPRGRTYARITETMGDTPLIALRTLGQDLPARILVKHEGFNPYNSVKDRIGVAMVEDALDSGRLREGMVVVEPTSGNTGIGVAFAATAYGYPCIFTMPDSMTVERRNLMKALGATLVLTPGDQGMKGAIQRAEDIAERLGDRAWVPGQFRNPANPDVHYRTTGPEIWEDTNGEVDIFIAGVGTGGTVTGAGRFLKEKNPDVHVIAVEPRESPVLSGGEPGGHKQQGIGAGFVPEILDTDVYDEVVQVSNEDALETARRLARDEAIFAGISSGSITWVALQVAA